ncbi:hypothetical protein [Knoellia subterranea]|uniref:hypothetical protein n=1 Tax=Knoellia subterranea TaxID=184882 RepID=UPI000562E5A5|nr:hypothetical protein [Knoellia subterranea]
MPALDGPDAEPRATRANLVSAAVVAAVGCVYMGYAVRTGLPLGDAARALAAIAITQVLPGALLWRAVRPRRGWLLEDVAMGFALGIAIAVPTQVVAGLLGQRWPAFVIPLAVAAVLVAVPRTRRRIMAAQWSPMAWWLAPLVSLISFWALRQLVAYFRTNQITWTGLGRPHIDAYLHQALASQLLHRGPTSWPTVAGEDLGYHWFTHAWLAHVTATSGAGLDLVLLRVMPALMPLTVVVCVAVAALRLSRSSKVALLASGLAMVASGGNPFGYASFGLPLNPDSPTLALGVPTLLALVVLLAQRWNGELSRTAYVLVPWLSVIAAGTKGATSPLVVAGLGLAAVAMLLWNRRLFGKVVVDTLVVGGGLIFALIVVFHGSSAGLALGITDSSKQTYVHVLLGSLPGRELVLAAAALAVISGLTRAALSFAPMFGRESRRQPLSWLLAGGSIAGAAAVGLFSHPGQSQYYFLLTAIPLAAIGSAMGARSIVHALGPDAVRRLLPLAVVAGGLIHLAPTRLVGELGEGTFQTFWRALAVAAVLVVATAAAGWFLGDPGRRLMASLATTATAALAVGGFAAINTVRAPLFAEVKRPASLTERLAISQDQLDAARWIRDHSDPDDLVMTNRHCTVPRKPVDGCDSRRWVVTAFSERQSLVEGWTATPEATKRAPHGRDSVTVNYWKPDILELNDGFIANPTAEAQRRLWDLGVRWVYVDNLQAHADDLAPFAERGFDSPDASAWKLLEPGR